DLPLLVDVAARIRIDSLWPSVTDISAVYSWDSSVLQYGGYNPPQGWTTTSLNVNGATAEFRIHRLSGVDSVPLDLGIGSFYPRNTTRASSQIKLVQASLRTTSKEIALCIRTDEGHEWWVNLRGEAAVGEEAA